MTDVVTDLTSAGLRTKTFDLAVCFHVLEHIADDRDAMRELHRILKQEGLLIAQVPLDEQTLTEEDPAASPAERLRRFGKDDHVRSYGIDVVDRLTDAGFSVSLNKPRSWLSGDLYQRYALAGDDQVLIIGRP